MLAFVLLYSFNLKGQDSVKHDKDYLLDYFSETAGNLEKSVKGLSPEQMNFKPAEDRWSVSECLEHIILIDKALSDMAKKVIEAPANPERKGEVKASDEEIITGMTDRSQKAQAPEFGIPKGIYSSTAEALKVFKEQRKQMREYIKNTSANLRDHITDSPGGPVDAYQFLLFISGHSARHTLQIEEVKADPGFPK